MSNFSEFFGGSGAAKRWVTGTAYALDADAWSPASGHVYRRIVAGAGATDPSADPTNWKIVGPGGVKSIQRGVTTMTWVSSTTATISSVNMARSEVRLLGRTHSRINTQAVAPEEVAIRLVLTNSTTLTMAVGFTLVSGNSFLVSWEVTEFWA